ncbi:UvrD-helicase domain-containing protein [Nocardia aurantia]|uniref:UvrD-helicase domain-containing protein n=1 Tax=Nocardia aurantia TaxID=2585199 RepID=UPI003872D64A
MLEASAGTGKTYAIVGLAVRFVAEMGVDVSQLLLVTFSRAATQELRERTRDRFVAVAAGLADPEAGRHSDDELIRHLVQADPAEVARRRARVLAALSDFDAGTIATTHSFCQRMLDELGLAGEQDPGARLVDNVDDLVATVADDLYLSRYARGGAPFPMKEAYTLARAAVQDRHARLAPGPEIGDHPAADRVGFAAAVRTEVERRKRLSGLRDFDDLLVLLHEVLSDPAHGERACRRIRDRYRVVLVDEFQDTDPLQWDILRRCFHGHAALVLVGDPKQAIYAFRGAEVLSYLDAVAQADGRRELTTNRRSDAGLLSALAHLMGGAALGHHDIAVHPVSAVRPRTRLEGATTAPLRLRYFTRDGAGPKNKSGFPTVGRQRSRVADDLAADVVALLDSGVRLGDRPVGPGDIAVLVRTRAQIDLVRAALDKVGVASVLTGGASVFGTEAATDWLWLLRALEQPHRGDRVRLAAGTPLLGLTAAEIDVGGADLVGRLSTQLREGARLFGRAGFAAVFEKLAAETRLAPRLLAVAGGERQLTDLRHLAQLLDQAALRESLGLTALTRWLADRVRDPASGAVSDRSRRLDRDDAAVQIATVHASKGLEFPVVYLPFAWDSAKNPNPVTLLFHEDGDRVLDVGGPEAPGYTERKKFAEAEESGEELRLLYVALTRAQCQVVAWWAPAYGTTFAPLHRMIFGRGPGTPDVAAKAEVPPDQVCVEQLPQWAADAGPGLIDAERVTTIPKARPRWERAEPATGELAAAVFDRDIDHDWRRTSYSALTAGAHDTHSQPDEAPGVSDEPETPVDLADATESPSAAASLMNDLPYGAEFGVLVHGVLELVDTDAPDLATEVRRRCADAVAELMADIDVAALSTALLAVLHTPLGGSPTTPNPASRSGATDQVGAPTEDPMSAPAATDPATGRHITESPSAPAVTRPGRTASAAQPGPVASAAHPGPAASVARPGPVASVARPGPAASPSGRGPAESAGGSYPAESASGPTPVESASVLGVSASRGEPAGRSRTALSAGRDRAAVPMGSLAAVANRDRLNELAFELPLAGGETPAAEYATLHRIAALLRRHLPAGDPFESYPDQLDALDDTPLRGYLTGSIDAVLRLPGPRFVVVDYKTNRLGTGDLTVDHYTPDRMAAEMMRSHYPLQAILYSVALHRYLRWRLPGYRPEEHLGGIRYLFVRGMIGPETPPGCGVSEWDPPAALITDLSALLAGEVLG